MKHPVTCVLCILLLAHCASPDDIAYCERFGVTPEHSEYSNCLNYYDTQYGAYAADRAACARKADETYPPTLYDHGRSVYDGGFGFGGFGRYHGGGWVHVPPDRGRNAQVDALRNRIIHPCMRDKGWNNPDDWEAGRNSNAPKKPKEKPKSRVVLPWLS